MLRSNEILGLNRRHLQYVKKLNPKKQIRLVDKKYKAKQFLSQRGIPFAETYGFIKNREDLLNYNFGKIPVNEFVIKPNQWSWWKGIFQEKG